MAAPVIPTKPPVDLEIPGVFGRLGDLAYNLWWSWSPEAHRLFHAIDPAVWRRYRNPIEVLIDLPPQRWEVLADDDEFARRYHELIAQFDGYVAPKEPTWFDANHPGHEGGPFAYFSTEYGWHECLQIYSGGLGVLSGDHCKSASDLGLPFVGIGLMYHHGYFHQSIDAEGFQQHYYPNYDLRRLPLVPVADANGRELYVAVDLPGRQVQLRVWRALVGRVPVLLLDSDLPINHHADRPITSMLYVRGREMRLCQELLLGVGGVRTLAALGIRPSAWHINEGHSALLAIERMARRFEAGEREFDTALAAISENTVFTTHTPVPAGNETFDVDLARPYVDELCRPAGLETERFVELARSGGDGSFNLTALALGCSARANGVSALHGEVADGMWRGLLEKRGRPAIGSVTNGVHHESWLGPEIGALLRRHLGDDFARRLMEPGFADAVLAIPDHEVWTAHLAQKRHLIDLIRESTRRKWARHGRSPGALRAVDSMFDGDKLVIGFARRFATYKRADLILRDNGWLQSLVGDDERPVQLVFAGKAHPADRPGQDLIRRIVQAAGAPEFRGRITFLENYDMHVARSLVQGVDVWLNTPQRPLEASGTSGMKAAMNGVLNCSILDGWWCEGYAAERGWSIGDPETAPPEDEGARDHEDAEALYHVLSGSVIPTYYDRNPQGLPEQWIAKMKRAIADLSPRFSTERMVRDYVEGYYVPAARSERPVRTIED